MRLSTLEYYFREAFTSIWRNGWLSAASAGVVAISLFLLGTSLLLVVNVNSMAAGLESNVEATIFLKDGLTAEQVSSVGRRLAAQPEVVQVVFVSKERALEEMKEKFGEKKDILEGLEEKNPLPDSYRVKTAQVSQVALLAQKAEQWEEVDQVRYGQGVVEKIMVISRWIRTAGAAAIVLLGLASVFLIATTIRLSVFSRRKEIGIMKFLGATNWFVRLPFLLEGMILGLAGALAAAAVVYAGYFSLIGRLNFSLPFFQPVADRALVARLMEGILFLGLSIGAAGSFLSIRRFLRV